MRRGVVTSVLLACTLVSGCSTLKPLTEPQPTPTVSASKVPQGIDAHPAWAVPVARSGKKLGHFGDDRIRIEVDQAAIAKAPGARQLCWCATSSQMCHRNQSIWVWGR